MAIKKEEKEEIKEGESEEELAKIKDPKITDVPGIGPGIASKLEAAGVYDLMGLAVMSPPALSDMAGIGEAVARKAIQAARSMMKLGFVSGDEFARRRENVGYITSGSKNFNDLLGGKGIETKSMTECYGAFGSGKCVSKDTEVSYFNDTRMHIEPIEKTYEKYAGGSKEFDFEEGKAVPVSTVKVLTWNDGKLEINRATHLYKEKVENLIVVKTKRGRVLKITGNHQLLSFDEGVKWKKAGFLKRGDLIASPRKIDVKMPETNHAFQGVEHLEHPEHKATFGSLCPKIHGIFGVSSTTLLSVGKTKRLLDLVTESEYDCDDAYFLGLFVAEGGNNPFAITTGSEKLKDWVVSYVKKRFGIEVRVNKDNRRESSVYRILLRKEVREIMDGLDGCNSENKFIPEAIFLSDEKVIKSFLGGYLDGDGEISSKDISMTTKSKRLASQLSYLLWRIGVSASFRTRKNEVYGNYFVVRVSGEDRKKLFDTGFKLKKFDIPIKNSYYGYPREIVRFISDLYKESIGGNRGSLRKRVGKRSGLGQGYINLVGGSNSNVINEGTLEGIKDIFEMQKDLFVSYIRRIEESGMSDNFLKEIYEGLPFAFNSLSENMGLRSGSIRNYYSRKIPHDKVELLGNLILNELKTRVDVIVLALELIEEIRMFNWDVVEDARIINYNDYVYDFVVPEGHSFVGGNMPTMMHNTQLGLTLSVNVQMPKEQGGLNGKAVFVDTEGTFRPERIRQIAEGIGANPEKVLKNILVARAFNSDHQILLLDKIGEMIKDGEPIKLLIIDSLTAHFRAEFAGRGQLADRQHKLNRYLHDLMRLAEQHNLAVYVTNQVMSNPAMMFGDPTTAIGGNIVGHACLTGDSLIQLGNGEIIEIRDMKKENKIISAEFDKLRIGKADSEEVFINPDVNKIYNIKTNGQINCSGLHRFFTIEDFEIGEREAKDLREGEFIAQAGKVEIVGEDREIPKFKLKRIGMIDKVAGKMISNKLKEEDITRIEVCQKVGITPRQLRRVLNEEKPTSFEVLENLQNSFGGGQMLQILPVYTNKHKNLIIPEFLNQNLGQIFGYFIGDGNFEERGLRFRDARQEVLQNYSSLFKQVFNVDGVISKMKSKNCYTLNINSKEIRNLFEMMVPQILNEIGKSKDDVVRGFIKGFVDAGGHIDRKRATISVSQKEKSILRYLQLFLLRFGIRSTIKFDIGKKKINILRISDKDIKEYLQIGFTANDKQKRLFEVVNEIQNKYSYEMMPIERDEIRNLLRDCGLNYSNIIKPRTKDYKWISRKELEGAFNALMNCEIKDSQVKQKIEFIRKLLTSDVKFEKIREIKIINNDKNEKLYDFSVPKNKNYIANGFIVHNSTYRIYLRRGKQGSRVAKLIDSPNLPDNECQFWVTESGVRDEE